MEKMTQIQADHISFLRRKKIKTWVFDWTTKDKPENLKKNTDFADSDWIMFPFVYNRERENM